MKKEMMVVLSALTLTGCLLYERNKEQPKLDLGTDGFASIQALMNNRCVNCHNSGKAGGGVDLSSFDGIRGEVAPGNPEASRLFVVVANNSMPKNSSPLSGSEKGLIKQWISDGAPQVWVRTPGVAAPVVGEPAPVDFATLEVNYANLKKHILEPHCTRCHGSKKAEMKIRLDSHERIINHVIDDDLMDLVVSGQSDFSNLYYMISLDEDFMPPADKGYERLPEDQIDYVKRWIDGGAKE